MLEPPSTDAGAWVICRRLRPGVAAHLEEGGLGGVKASATSRHTDVIGCH